MTIETSTYIADWNSALPANTDAKSEGDDHIRKIKADVQATLPGFAGRFRRIQTKSAAYTAVLNDNSSILRTSGTWTLSGTAVATLGNGWEILVYNDGSGTITFDPSGAELVNGAATLTIAAGTCAFIWCDGSAFRAINIVTTDTAQTITGEKTLQSTDAGAGAGPLLNLDRNSASPAASDVLAAIPFKGRDSGAGTDTYAQIQAEIVDPTATSEDGKLALQTAVAGTLATRGYIQNGLVMGSATGGDQGAGTGNFTNVYINGSAIGTALQHLENVSFSGAAGQSFSTVLETGVRYRIAARLVKSTTARISLRFNSDSGGNYFYTSFGADETAAITPDIGTGASHLSIGGGTVADTRVAMFTIEFETAQGNTDEVLVEARCQTAPPEGTANGRLAFTGGHYNGASALSAVEIDCIDSGGGAGTMTGSANLWKYRTS